MASALVMAVLTPQPLSASPAAGEIRLAGGDGIVWLIERHRLETAGMALAITYRRTEPTGAQRFYPLMPAGSLSGRVLRTLVRGKSLHAFYRDGSHWRYTPHPRGPWQVQTRLDHVEVSLPNATVPLALAADAKTQAVLAIVPSRIANLLTAKQRADFMESTAGETNALSHVPTTTFLQDFTTELALVRYEERRWIADRPAPSDFSLEATHVGLLAADGVAHLVYAQPGPKGSPRLIYRVSQAADKAWSAPIVIPMDAALSVVAMGWINDQPMLAIAYEKSQGLMIRLAELNGEVWTMREPLSDASGKQVNFSGRLAMAFSGNKLAVAVMADDGDVQFGMWPMVPGGAMLSPASITSQIRPAPPAVSPSVRILVQYGVLGGVLAVLFFWRREHVVLVPVLKSNEISAPHLRRSFALIIDIFVTLPVWLPVMLLLWQFDGMSLEDYRQANQQYEGTALGWYGLPTLGLVLGVYASIFEGFRQATLGKQAMGLAVKMHNGMACTWSAAIGRNAARIIEFAFPPLVLLVVMTPSKLRLGDMLARTLVVQKLEFLPNPVEFEEDSSSDQSESN